MPSESLPVLTADVSVFGDKLKPGASTLLTLRSGTPAFDACVSFPDFSDVKKAKGQSFTLIESKDRPKDDNDVNDDDDDCCGSSKKTSSLAVAAGVGVHTAEFKGKVVYMALQSCGLPVSTNCGVQMYQYMTVAVEGKQQQSYLHEFVDYAIELANTCNDTKTIKVFRWHTKYRYWQQQKRQLKRPISTIILDKSKMKTIVDDVKDFQSAQKWYQGHGIPYKRCYMFYGPPGTGKSSTIRALASHFDRALCFLQPSDEHCTDESFKKAMETAPTNALIAIEDIDALFDVRRRSLNSRCPLTFSGLLNGIDGIGAPHGQIIMMTTNYMDRLDPALVRAGRCDVTIKMDHASPKQMQDMFLRFFPNEKKEAERFSSKLNSVKALSMAALQNHFIIHRKSNAKECVDGLYIKDGKLILLAKGEFREKENAVKEIAEKKNDEKQNDEDYEEVAPKNINDWSVANVINWVKKSKLGKSIENHMQSQKLDGSMLKNYTIEEMSEDNLEARGDRNRLARAIKDLFISKSFA